MLDDYTKEFYDEINDSSRRSAQIITPLLLELWPVKSVIDFGCAQGIWLAEFASLGVQDIVGVDGNWVALNHLNIERDKFVAHDFTNPFHIGRKFDLALCLEVAEHLTDDKADQIVEDLVRVAPIIFFSAAIPYQDGTNHYNCQWPEYWASRFRSKGYLCCDFLRKQLWNQEDVSFVYRQNSMVYMSEDYFMKMDRSRWADIQIVNSPERLVHPDFYICQSSIASARKDAEKLVRYNWGKLKASVGCKVRRWVCRNKEVTAGAGENEF